MAVDTKHPAYIAMESKWKRCRDAAAGQDAIHAAGTAYLPKLKDQTQEDYDAYKLRAGFYNASWRTIAGLVGMIFRKPPKVEVAENVKAYLADVTTSGVPFQVFAQQTTEECMSVGRVGVLVDCPNAPDVRTRSDELKLNIRPSMQLYKAETIINWRTGNVNNQHVLTLVVLQEDFLEQDGEFAEKVKIRYRVLDLIKSNIDGVEAWRYRVRIYEVENDGTNKKDVQIGPDLYPKMNGAFLSGIPFWFFGADDITPKVDEPPLIDLVDVNLSHYRTTADYEHGCHFTGLPTAVVSGYTPAGGTDGQPVEKLYIGSQTAWIFPNPDASATFLEFTGQGLSALETNLDRKESQMAVLGARMLAQEKKAAEAAETASIHRSGENSVLSGVSQTISQGLTMALIVFSEWCGATDKALCELNRDFFPIPMTPEQLSALVKSWQSNAISYETLYRNLQRGEIVAHDKDVKTETDEIAANPAVVVPPDPAPAK